jgi:hypothetical protein
LVRALDCGSRGPPFEPGRRYHGDQANQIVHGAGTAAESPEAAARQREIGGDTNLQTDREMTRAHFGQGRLEIWRRRREPARASLFF